MPGHDWLRNFVHAPWTARLAEQLPGGVPVDGSSGSCTHLLAGAMAVRREAPALLVVAHLDDADEAYEDLGRFPEAGLALERHHLSAIELGGGDPVAALEPITERLAVLEAVTSGALAGRPAVVVAPVQALMQSVPVPERLQDLYRHLAPGTRVSPPALLAWLDAAGYERTDVIEQPGDFAARGGIVDLYLPAAAHPDLPEGPTPIRIEWFGDEIDTLAVIDATTMGSGARIDSARIVGASTEQLQQEEATTGFHALLPDETAVLLDEVLEVSEQARGYYERLADPRGIIGPDALLAALTRFPHARVQRYAAPEPGSLTLPVRPSPAFDEQGAAAVRQLGEAAAGQAVTVLSEQPAEKERLAELIGEHAPAARGRVALEIGYLHRGFGFTGEEGERLIVPHHELFHRYHTRRRVRRLAGSLARTGEGPFQGLEPGDYVVHEAQGIAIYRGLRSITRRGHREDYLTLEFAGGDRLQVPAAEIDKVQRYVGGFAGKPPLSKLGGQRWQKQKAQASEAVRALAEQMLRLQAARASMPGIRFPEDTPWQKAFEAEFPYEETEDQLAAITAVKRQMSDQQPMDRLICGDVGFGKTEVALRAAFKAVASGYQVAVLVPTTVLAEQHERTFRQRMADYPFTIRAMSRMRGAAARRGVIRGLADGSVDVVIGTHRLLSRDVHFANLGLLIIDEEQRFGVRHKQKLLDYRLTADVLTLTATPIPRTLHMAVLGLRDISPLSTPPADRRAVVTEVIPNEPDRYGPAIERELAREGQVFFVHNRVHDIEQVAAQVQALVPAARVIVGHGQMSGRELEQVMLKFLRREADVLVSTTIIESGVDIPTANTMIIDDADQYGLADLHQLRGRVGRWKHRAYCYMLLPRDRPVTDRAARRLKAIEQYSMLGAGFRIAMRDLEIRGAGNLLGAEQSGHIAAVGYEMYCRLLEREAKRQKGEPAPLPVRTHLELGVEAHLPASWIGPEKHRLAAYRRLSEAMTRRQYQEVREELVKAWGEPPPEAARHLAQTELRIAAAEFGIESIRRDGPDLVFRAPDPETLARRFAGAPGRVTVLDEATLYVRPPAGALAEPDTRLATLGALLTGEGPPEK